MIVFTGRPTLSSLLADIEFLDIKESRDERSERRHGFKLQKKLLKELFKRCSQAFSLLHSAAIVPKKTVVSKQCQTVAAAAVSLQRLLVIKKRSAAKKVQSLELSLSPLGSSILLLQQEQHRVVYSRVYNNTDIDIERKTKKTPTPRRERGCRTEIVASGKIAIIRKKTFLKSCSCMSGQIDQAAVAEVAKDVRF